MFLQPVCCLIFCNLQSLTFHICPGTFAAGIDLPDSTSLEEREAHLTGDDQRRFLDFMRKMLQWAPERRSPARELFEDPWLQEQA